LPDSKPVAGAVLFGSKTDMGPGGMAEMTGKVSPLPGHQPNDELSEFHMQAMTLLCGFSWKLGADC
jgi:hypothetical protein